jgi:hypothetical protein
MDVDGDAVWEPINAAYHTTQRVVLVIADDKGTDCFERLSERDRAAASSRF